MRNFYYGVAGLAAVCLSGAANAQSQSTAADFTPTNIAVRIGIGLPLDKALQDYGSPLIAAGIEYQVSGATLGSSVSYLSLDYLTASTNFSGGVFPLCINQRYYLNHDKNSLTRTYGFIGLGGAVVNVNRSNTVLAGRAGLGADIGPNTFIESTLLITDKANGASGDSVSLYVGYRF